MTSTFCTSETILPTLWIPSQTSQWFSTLWITSPLNYALPSIPPSLSFLCWATMMHTLRLVTHELNHIYMTIYFFIQIHFETNCSGFGLRMTTQLLARSFMGSIWAREAGQHSYHHRHSRSLSKVATTATDLLQELWQVFFLVQSGNWSSLKLSIIHEPL